MASASRPIITTGVAIASAAAIVAATPALLSYPSPEVHIAAAPVAVAPLRQLSVADIQLLNTFTLQGLVNTIVNGYGGIVTGDPTDPTGFVCDTDAGAVCKSLVFGAAYYLTDTLLLPNTNLDNHLFEQGLITGLAEFARDQGAPPALIDLIEKPFSAPIVISTALFGATSPITQFVTALWNGGLVGVIKFLINGPTPPPTTPTAKLLSDTTETGVQTLDASLAPEAGTSAVGKFTAPDLSKVVSLQVTPKEKDEAAVTGGDAVTVDTTAADTTKAQDPTTAGGTVETVTTEAPAVTAQDPATEAGTVETVTTQAPAAGAQDPATEAGTAETVTTQDPATDADTVEPVKAAPKLNETKVNPLAGLNGKPVVPVTSSDGSSAKPESGLTKAIKKFVSGLGKHQKNEGTGTGGAAADGGGSDSGGGDAG